MRNVIVLILCLLPFVSHGADHTVCASGCDYTSPWDAYAAASCGDTITLTAGETFSPGVTTLTNKNCSEWITFRSSQAHMLPNGYRPSIDDTRLAKIAFTADLAQITVGSDEPAFSNNCWVSQLSGNVVTVGHLHSDSLTCEARLTDGTLYTSNAPVCTVTFLNQTSTYAGTSGDQGTGLRVGLGTDGKCHISHRSDVVENIHFTCTNCTATGERDTWIHFNFPDNTVPLTNIAYSTAGVPSSASSSRRVWLSGPQAARTDMPGLYPGTYADAYKGPALGISHIRFKGIHFRYDSTVARTYGVAFIRDSFYDYHYVPHHIEWDRCVFSTPKAIKNYWGYIRMYNCDGCVVKDTAFLNFNANTSVVETQPLYLSSGEGSILLENVSVDGGTENFLTGGNNSKVVGVPKVTVRRSLFRKRREQRPSIRLVRQTSTYILGLTAADATTACDSGTCTYYYEDTPYTCTQNSTVTVASGASVSGYFGVSPTGVLTFGHNSGVNVTCSGGITCLDGVTSRADIAEYAMLYEWAATSGDWSSSASWSFGNFYHKNLFELKTGQKVVLEGNVLKNYWAAGGQYNAFGFTPRNQNGPDVHNRIDGLVIRRNKLFNAHAGLSVIGIDDMGGNTIGRGYVFEDNIIDVDKANWGNSTSGGVCFNLNGDGNVDVVIRRNTCVSTNVGAQQMTTSISLNTVLFHDNIWVWPNNAYYLGSLSGQGLSPGFTNVRKADLAITAYGYIAPSSEYRGNLNISSTTISSTGWNSWTDSASVNLTGNQRAQSVTLTDHFQGWVSPSTSTTNLRLATTSPYSVHCTSGCDTQLVTQTGTDPGADLDLVDTLTDGVEDGLPERARRWNVSVEHNGTSVSVRAVGMQTFTLEVSTHQNFKTANVVYSSSTPTSDVGGFKTWTVTGLPVGTTYWYKLTDGTSVVKAKL